MSKTKPTIVMDDAANADWSKQSWDFPPYKSADFLALIGGIDKLDEFRKRPAYKMAVERGLILDDEWMGPPEGYAGTATRTEDAPRLPRGVRVTIHRH